MRLTIFNVGRGSSILIELPNTDNATVAVGIVDCFSGVTRASPLLQALDELERKAGPKLAIEFFVLTHLHADHFLGVSQILAKYQDRILNFYEPGIDPRAVMAADYRTKEKFDTRVQKDLSSIFEFKQRYPDRCYSLTSPGMNIYVDAVAKLSVRNIAPEGNMLSGIENVLSDYIRKLRKAVAKHQALPTINKSYDLNRTSSAIEIVYRDMRLILGGDVLNPTWKTVLSRGQSLESDMFLLSHHGASNAFPSKQWHRVHKNNTHTVISGRGYGQPSPSVLEKLKGLSTPVWVTNVPDGYENNDHAPSYVATLHYGAKIRSDDQRGDVICSCSDTLSVTGPRLL